MSSLSTLSLEPIDALEQLEIFKDVLLKDKEAEIMYICIKARFLAALGKVTEALENLQTAEKKLDNLFGVDLSIRGEYHLAFAHLSRFRGDWERVYKEAMLYLSYTSLNTIQHEDIIETAELISVAALAAPRVVDIAEFSGHAILKTLRADSNLNWLAELVTSFSSGDIPSFEANVKKYQSQLNSHPVLGGNMTTLIVEKVTLLSLVNLAFHQSSKRRSLSFTQIINHCKIPENKIETFVMRTVARGLVKAQIDEVNQMVRFTWVKPQILNKDQLKLLRDRLEEWAESAEKLASQVSEMSPEALGDVITSSK